MSELFLHVINMSISASYVAFAVLLLRFPLKKAPRWISVLLWGFVGIRLLLPFSLESALSLIPSAEAVSPDIMMDSTPSVNTGIPVINSTLNPIITDSLAPAPGDSANPLQILIPILSVIWVIGMITLFAYTAISYVKLKRKVGTAVIYCDNVYMSENVTSPFVLGIIKPRIYLPFGIDEGHMTHVIAHEEAHIRRRDYLWKPIGFLLLTVHWFNPLMWLGYILLCRDIELACDEKVIGELGTDARADYSEALLACSVSRRAISACPLAFGEVGVKDRVRSVLNYKKPAFWIIVVALIVCASVAVFLLTDPKDEKGGEVDPEKLTQAQREVWEEYPEYFGLDSSDGLDVYVCQFALGGYSFSLTSHSIIDKNTTELMALKSTSASQMRTILSSYDVDGDEIYIKPWQNPFSSYIGSYWLHQIGEDLGIKRRIYTENVKSMILDTSWGHAPGEGNDNLNLLYMTPTMSWVDSSVSRVRISAKKLYDADTGELIGTLKEFTLTPSNLDNLMEMSENYAELTEDIRENNVLAFEITPTKSKAVNLYYILVQNDGSIIIVYGHYENGEKADFIRWIYDTGKM
ncbi:MAG: transcriptional regulator [Clostridia bacterium]|nr:transcriptional regulator [Clostridia bacterium]